MDDEENVFSETQNDLSSMRLVEYLIGRIAALETRIEQIEGKSANPSENDTLKELVSKYDEIDRKLDMLIGLTANALKDEVEDIGGRSGKEIKPQEQSNAKKKQVAVFIDGENISHKKAKKIVEYANSQGTVEFLRVYGVQNNNSDKCWVKTSNELGIKHIRLAGGSKKNKVDKKMFEEILNESQKKDHADTIIIATNDADFIPTIEEIKAMGIRAVTMGLKSSLSDKMKKVCNSFVYL